MSEKDAYVQKLHAKIDEWSANIDKLAAQANQVEADSRIEYHKQIETLKRKQDEIKNKLNEMRGSGDEAWNDLKSGIDLAWEAMNEAIKSARSRFD